MSRRADTMTEKGLYWAKYYAWYDDSTRELAHMLESQPRTKAYIRGERMAELLACEPVATHIEVEFYDDWGRADDDSPPYRGRQPMNVEHRSRDEWIAISTGGGAR